MRVQISLYGDDATEFEEMRERIEQQRPGGKVSNPEAVRVLMDVADVTELAVEQ